MSYSNNAEINNFSVIFIYVKAGFIIKMTL